jgi:hypothetical protein
MFRPVVRGYKNVDLLIGIVDIVDCVDPYYAAKGQVNGEEAKH